MTRRIPKLAGPKDARHMGWKVWVQFGIVVILTYLCALQAIALFPVHKDQIITLGSLLVLLWWMVKLDVI